MSEKKTNIKIRVLILGSGFAAKGHTEAFRYCGADVVGIVSRNKAVVEEVAKELNIPHTFDNWEKAVLDLKPDVLSLANDRKNDPRRQGENRKKWGPSDQNRPKSSLWNEQVHLVGLHNPLPG